MHGSFVSSPTNSVTADFKASPSTTSTRSVDEEDDGDDGDDGDEEVFPSSPCLLRAEDDDICVFSSDV